jgi:hypothetical protein
MRIYTIHPRRSPAAGAPLDAVSMQPEAFSWAAFVFGPFWLAAKSLWLYLAAWLAVAILYAALATATLGAATSGSLLVGALLLQALLGFEAHNLTRRALERSGRGAVDVVYARDRGEALARYLRRRLERASEPAAVRPSMEAAAPRRPGEGPFLGLFQDGDEP